jgi:hypothetical protein
MGGDVFGIVLRVGLKGVMRILGVLSVGGRESGIVLDEPDLI